MVDANRHVLSLTPEDLDVSVSIEYTNSPDEPSAAALLKMAEADEGKWYSYRLSFMSTYCHYE